MKIRKTVKYRYSKIEIHLKTSLKKPGFYTLFDSIEIDFKKIYKKFRKPSNNDPAFLIETHETSFSGSILRSCKWDMKKIKIFTYSPDLTLSNQYLEAIIQS